MVLFLSLDIENKEVEGYYEYGCTGVCKHIEQKVTL